MPPKAVMYAHDVYVHLFVNGASDLRDAAEKWRADSFKRTGRPEHQTPLFEMKDPIVAYINEGRWLVNCECGNGCPCTPPGSHRVEAVCFACGAVWTNIQFPPELTEIENLLAVRIFARNRNWYPNETVEDLRRENREHADRIKKR